MYQHYPDKTRGVKVNLLSSPNLGGFLKRKGDTPKTPAGERSPAPLLYVSTIEMSQ
jgi:hypothetical protein